MTSLRSERNLRVIGAGLATLEAIVGAGAVALVLLGLLGVAPVASGAFAAVVVGLGLLFESAALTAHYDAARRAETPDEEATTGSGLTAELLAAAAGVVLGALALLGVEPGTLIPTAAVLLGCGLLIGGGTTALSRRISEVRVHDRAERVSGELAARIGSGEVMVGAVAVVLGILALLRVGDRVTLTLVALLGLAIAVTFGGIALTARLTTLARRSASSRGDLPGGPGPLVRP